MCAASHVLFCDKLCLGCAVRFLETTITATHRVTVTFVGLARTIFYLGLQSWWALLASDFIWIDRYLSNSFYYILDVLTWYWRMYKISLRWTAHVFDTLFTRNNHEGTDCWFLPCSLWILSSWIHMSDLDWSVFSAAGKCSELLLAFALWRMT